MAIVRSHIEFADAIIQSATNSVFDELYQHLKQDNQLDGSGRDDSGKGNSETMATLNNTHAMADQILGNSSQISAAPERSAMPLLNDTWCTLQPNHERSSSDLRPFDQVAATEPDGSVALDGSADIFENAHNYSGASAWTKYDDSIWGE